MPRTKEQNEAMRQATNEKIILATTVLFSRKGVAGTGVQEIADSAGISIGLLYKHYKTKHDILKALVQSALDGLKTVGDFFDGEPLEKIKWFAKDILNDIENNDEYVHLMNVLSTSNITDENFPSRPEILEGHMTFRGKLVDLIKRGQETGVFRPGDPAAMALLFLTVVDGLCSVKLALQEHFVMPSVNMLTAFIIKEEFNDYV